MESGCSEDSPECWCPCGCGCQNDPNGECLPFHTGVGGETVGVGKVGMCHSCAQGLHEVPPEGVRSLARLIAAHESILVGLRKLQEGEKS